MTCALCDEPLPPPKRTGRKRIYCGDPECTAAYNVVMKRLSRARRNRVNAIKERVRARNVDTTTLGGTHESPNAGP